MRKLKLSIDGLRVESFNTQSPERPAGTVVGQEATQGHGWTCDPCENTRLLTCWTAEACC